MANIRILIISHNSFSKVYNNGKTLESLFQEFDKFDLAQLFFSQNEYPDFEYCEKYFQITDRNVLDRFFCFYSKCGNEVSGIELSKLRTKSDNLFNAAKKKSKYMNFFRDLLWKTNVWKTKELDQWCLTFNPDVIFYVGGNLGFSHTIASYVSNLVKKPLVTYFTDDYLIFPKNRNAIEIIQRWRMRRFYKKTVDQSSLLFTIGELMSKKYAEYFCREFYPIMNSVLITPYIPYKSNNKITISYFGGVHLERWKMMIRLAKAIEGVNFHVYTIVKPSQEILNAFQEVNIVYKEGLQGDDLQLAVLNSDILLHVESDDIYYKSLTMLSVSTKIPEYLMSGRAVLGFGPSEVASIRVLSDNNIGFVIPSTVTGDELKRMMNTIVKDYELRCDIGLRGYNFAVNNFNNADVVSSFSCKIKSVINQ